MKKKFNRQSDIQVGGFKINMNSRVLSDKNKELGLTEKEVKVQGKDYKVSTFPLAANGRSLGENEPNGFIKIIFDKKYGEVLGAHMLAYNASELLGEIGVTMKLEGTAEEIAQTIHAHPTLSEIILEASHGYDGKPIHM